MGVQDNWHLGLKLWQRGRKDRVTVDTNVSVLKTGWRGRLAKRLHLVWEPGHANYLLPL